MRVRAMLECPLNQPVRARRRSRTITLAKDFLIRTVFDVIARKSWATPAPVRRRTPTSTLWATYERWRNTLTSLQAPVRAVRIHRCHQPEHPRAKTNDASWVNGWLAVLLDRFESHVRRGSGLSVATPRDLQLHPELTCSWPRIRNFRDDFRSGMVLMHVRQARRVSWMSKTHATTPRDNAGSR